jgi:mannitol 2-dehydrogenase
MIEYIYAPDNFEAVVQRLVDPAIRIVSLTITEGGYLMNNSGEFLKNHPAVVKDLASPGLPQSAFGIIIEALTRRRKAGIDAFTVMSCDNLRHNGNQAKKACLAFASLIDPEMANWIDENVTFPNSMVDRITPAMNAETRSILNARSGVNDLAPVIAEDFKQWVLEDNFKYGRPSYEVAGVTITQDVAPYEEAKIRLLNGSHQMLSFPAFLSGHRKVDAALSDPLFYDYIVSFLEKDASPWLQSIPGMEISNYKSVLMNRFQNAAIGDQIARLCLDGGSKIPGFLLPTMEANLRQFGTCHRLAFLLACYYHYIHTNQDDLGNQYELQEPNAMAILKPIIEIKDPLELLKSTHLVGSASNSNGSFISMIGFNIAIAFGSWSSY